MKHKVRQDRERHRAAIRERLRIAGVVRPGPESISWQINREVLIVAGWGRGILLQLAHPLVGTGVHQHSTFRGSLMASFRRLQSTVGAMLAITFGDDEAAISAAAGINAIHDRVNGQLQAAAGRFPAGHRYSAHDAELLRWVHATLLDSMLLAHERLVGPLTPEERDRYCAESAGTEPLLDIPAGLLPRNVAQLDAYVRETLASGTIAVTDGSRMLARAVLFPPKWRVLWPAFRPMQLMTIGWLPPEIRRGYGFSWTSRDERALARWTTALRWLRRLTPAPLREWPIARVTNRSARSATGEHAHAGRGA